MGTTLNKKRLSNIANKIQKTEELETFLQVKNVDGYTPGFVQALDELSKQIAEAIKHEWATAFYEDGNGEFETWLTPDGRLDIEYHPRTVLTLNVGDLTEIEQKF